MSNVGGRWISLEIERLQGQRAVRATPKQLHRKIWTEVVGWWSSDYLRETCRRGYDEGGFKWSDTELTYTFSDFAGGLAVSMEDAAHQFAHRMLTSIRDVQLLAAERGYAVRLTHTRAQLADDAVDLVSLRGVPWIVSGPPFRLVRDDGLELAETELSPDELVDVRRAVEGRGCGCVSCSSSEPSPWADAECRDIQRVLAADAGEAFRLMVELVAHPGIKHEVGSMLVFARLAPIARMSPEPVFAELAKMLSTDRATHAARLWARAFSRLKKRDKSVAMAVARQALRHERAAVVSAWFDGCADDKAPTAGYFDTDTVSAVIAASETAPGDLRILELLKWLATDYQVKRECRERAAATLAERD